jgi:enoyl-CoA hydratase/carnithine racemase
MTFSSNVLSLERTGAVGTLWLDRPEKRNALSTELWQAIPDALDELASDDAIGAIVLAGRGKSFCVGLDLAEGLGGSGSRGPRRRRRSRISARWKSRRDSRRRSPPSRNARCP